MSCRVTVYLKEITKNEDNSGVYAIAERIGTDFVNQGKGHTNADRGKGDEEPRGGFKGNDKLENLRGDWEGGAVVHEAVANAANGRSATESDHTIPRLREGAH